MVVSSYNINTHTAQTTGTGLQIRKHNKNVSALVYTLLYHKYLTEGAIIFYLLSHESFNETNVPRELLPLWKDKNVDVSITIFTNVILHSLPRTVSWG